MKIKQITENTTAGSIATVETSLGGTQSRGNPSIYGGKKVGTLFKGKKTKAQYANSVNESAEISEAQLEEDDVIVVPGQGRSRKNGLVPHGQSRLDHEVEMARSDLFSAAKNAQQVYLMIKDVGEDEGLDGWVQEKIIKANDYLNTIREYLEGKQVQGVAEDQVNELSGDLLKRAALVAKNKSNRAMDPEIHDALGGGYMNPLAKHYDTKSDKFSNRAAKVGQRDAVKTIASPAVMRKIGMAEQTIYEGIPADNDMGTIAGTNNKMTLGQWKQMWQKKMPNADMSLFRFPPNMQGSAIAYFDGWMNNPDARWDPQRGVAEAIRPIPVDDQGNRIPDRMPNNKPKRPFGQPGDAKSSSKGVVSYTPTGLIHSSNHGDVTPRPRAVSEGAKVDRMVKHVAQSEKKLGHSKKEAENIAWATANKRGMLNNKNKKA